MTSGQKTAVRIILIVMASLIAITLLSTLIIKWIYPTASPYRDSWILGRTAEEITEKYGEFDYKNETYGPHYVAGYSLNSDVLYGGPTYFQIHFDGQDIAEKVSLMEEYHGSLREISSFIPENPLTLSFAILIFLIAPWFNFNPYILLVLAVPLYLLFGFGALMIAKRRKLPHAGLAFLPFASNYYLGYFCNENRGGWICFGLAVCRILSFFLLFLPCSFTAIVGCLLIFSAGYAIIDLIYLKHLFGKIFAHGTVFFVLTIISLGLLKPLLIFITGLKEVSRSDV